MKLLLFMLFCALPGFSQDLRMADTLESTPPLVFPPLARMARVEGYAQIVISVKNGAVVLVEAQSDGHSPFKQSLGAIEASKRLALKFKFKDSVTGYMHAHFFYRNNLPLPPGSQPELETTIDWQKNIITFSHSAVTVDTTMVN